MGSEIVFHGVNLVPLAMLAAALFAGGGAFAMAVPLFRRLGWIK